MRSRAVLETEVVFLLCVLQPGNRVLVLMGGGLTQDGGLASLIQMSMETDCFSLFSLPLKT